MIGDARLRQCCLPTKNSSKRATPDHGSGHVITGCVDELWQVLAVRALIARAAARDALRWWDDEALSEAGLALAARLFPRWPERAALRMAMRAGRSRHRVALERFPGALHLFWLGNEVEHELERRLDNGVAAAGSIVIPPAVTSPEELGWALDALGAPPAATGRRANTPEIEIDARGATTLLERTLVLAAGYRVAGPAQPVFPYIRKAS